MSAFKRSHWCDQRQRTTNNGIHQSFSVCCLTLRRRRDTEAAHCCVVCFSYCHRILNEYSTVNSRGQSVECLLFIPVSLSLCISPIKHGARQTERTIYRTCRQRNRDESIVVLSSVWYLYMYLCLYLYWYLYLYLYSIFILWYYPYIYHMIISYHIILYHITLSYYITLYHTMLWTLYYITLFATKEQQQKKEKWNKIDR